MKDEREIRTITDDLDTINQIVLEMISALSTGRKSRARSLVITKLQEASLWSQQAMAEEKAGSMAMGGSTDQPPARSAS